jgi:hypothetical protein
VLSREFCRGVSETRGGSLLRAFWGSGCLQLDEKLRGSEYNRCDESGRPEKQHNIHDEIGHGTLPIHKPPSLRRGLRPLLQSVGKAAAGCRNWGSGPRSRWGRSGSEDESGTSKTEPRSCGQPGLITRDRLEGHPTIRHEAHHDIGLSSRGSSPQRHAYPSTAPMKRSRMLVIGRPQFCQLPRGPPGREPWLAGVARALSDVPLIDMRRPIRPHIRADHTAYGADHPAAE